MDKLSGGITEVNPWKYEQLEIAWAGSQVVPRNASWRSEISPNGVLACPAWLKMPWLLTLDPMTYQEDGETDDDMIYRADLAALAGAVRRFVESGKPGVAAVFVYAVRPHMRSQFWRFADDLGSQAEIAVVSCWLTHQGGNRNLAALLCSRFEFSPGQLPVGVRFGRD